MSKSEGVQFLSPVGRLVMGDCFKGNNTDAEGNPLIIKHGPNAGQPRTEYFIGLAIDKGDPGWSDFWAKIHGIARADFPSLFDAAGNCISPKFAFKVQDGDSKLPNSRGIKPCDREGWPGCYVVSMSDGFPPTVYTQGGAEILTNPESVKRGYYIRVAGSIRGNDSQQQPGVFINFRMIELIGFGQIIQSGPDAKAVLGAAPVAYRPAGMTAAPVAAPMAAPVAAPVAAPMAAPVAAPVVPDPAFLAGPPPAPSPAPTGPVMTPKAGGVAYAEFISKGWTPEMLKQHGYTV